MHGLGFVQDGRDRIAAANDVLGREPGPLQVAGSGWARSRGDRASRW